MNDSTPIRLIRAAREAFALKGFDAASVREITRDAEANLGAITYHFGSKQGLYDAVLEDVFEPVATVLAAADGGEGSFAGKSPLDRIETIVRTVLKELGRTPNLPLLIMQQAVRNRELPGPANRALRRILSVLVATIRQGQAEGSIREGDPLLLAVSIWAQPVYFGLLRRLAPDVLMAESRELPPLQAVADHAVAFIRQGLIQGTEATQ